MEPLLCAFPATTRLAMSNNGGVVGSGYPPLTLISSLLCLLQLGQSCGQTLLCTVQLLLNQLDTSVQGSYITLSLQEHKTTTPGSEMIYPSTHRFFC